MFICSSETKTCSHSFRTHGSPTVYICIEGSYDAILKDNNFDYWV